MLIFFILSVVLVFVNCDYRCICNYNVEKSVFETTSTNGDVFGYLYEFDCKPSAGDATTKGWLAIAFEHKLGFIEEDSQLQVQTCPGSIPDEDKLPLTTTTTIATTTSTRPTTSTITTPVATSKDTTISQTTTVTNNFTSTIQHTPIGIPLTNSITHNVTLQTLEMTTSPSTVPSKMTTSISKPDVTTASLSTYVTTSLMTINPTAITASSTYVNSNVTQKTAPSTVTDSFLTSVIMTRSTVKSVSNKTTFPTVPSTSSMPATSKKMPTTVSTTSTLPSTSQAFLTFQTTVIPIEGHTKLCPVTLQLDAMQSKETTLAQFRSKCYEVVQTKVSWTHAEINCLNKKAQLVDIRSQEEQNFLFHYLESIKSHTVWLGLNDRNTEEKFQWTSGEPVTYTNWKKHRQTWNHLKEDCVYMTVNGTWNDIYCGSSDNRYEQQSGFVHSYICQYDAYDPRDGQLNLCPLKLHQQADKDNAVLSQFKHSCFELVPNVALAWQHAENICEQRGGHLVSINSSFEQAFIESFMQRYSPHSSIWIGLSDSISQGTFHWTSGEAVQYTNWKQNYVNNNTNNCAILMPYEDGKWDNVPCGVSYKYSTTVFDKGEMHPLLCEYSTVVGATIIG